jgi:putative transposase
MLYLDNGSGYKNALMNDKTAGLYALFEIEPIFAIPGNARVKWIERFFKHMEERVGKRFESFCGRGHDERHKQLVLKEVKQGKRQLPSVEEWIKEFTDFLNDYHHSEHPEIKGKTRQQVWDEIDRVDPGIDDYSVLPRAKVNVLRGRVVLHKRTYSADFLHQFNGQELIAAYDLHDDSQVKIYKDSGEFVMFANLKSKTHALPTSRVVEATHNRLNGQLKRLAVKQAEAQARLTDDHVVDVASIEALAADTNQNLECDEPSSIHLDLNTFVIDGDYIQHQVTLDELLADIGDKEQSAENNYEL